MGSKTVTFDWLLDVATAVANLQVYRLAPLFLRSSTPLIFAADLFDERSRRVEDLYFAWWDLRGHTYFEEHVSVSYHVDIIVSACLKYDVLFFSRTDYSSEFVQDCFALFGNFLQFFFAIG